MKTFRPRARGQIGIYVAVAAAIASMVGYATDRGTSPTASAERVTSASLLLPAGFQFQSLITDRHGLEVLGYPQYFKAGMPCELSTVDPVALRIIGKHEVSCTDDLTNYGGSLAIGGSVTPVEGRDNSRSMAPVRLAIHDPHDGVTHVGPVVMTYEDASDTRPEWATADGTAWLYDCDTTDGSRLLRISEATGQVEADIKMPDDCRMLVAADDDGFWMDETSNSFAGRRPQLIHVGLHANKSQVIYTSSGNWVNWLEASGHTVVLAEPGQPFGPGSTGSILRFQGTDPHPVSAVSDDGLVPPLGGGIVGDASFGYWFAAQRPVPCPSVENLTGDYFRCWSWNVVHVDPSTGAPEVVAHLHPPMSFNDMFTGGDVQLLNGAVYFYAPPNPSYATGSKESATIYRLQI